MRTEYNKSHLLNCIKSTFNYVKVYDDRDDDKLLLQVRYGNIFELYITLICNSCNYWILSNIELVIWIDNTLHTLIELDNDDSDPTVVIDKVTSYIDKLAASLNAIRGRKSNDN